MGAGTGLLKPQLFINNYIIKKGIQPLKLIQKNITLHFVWVKAHIGIKNNEHVDFLGKCGAKSGSPASYEIGLSDAVVLAKQNKEEIW